MSRWQRAAACLVAAVLVVVGCESEKRSAPQAAASALLVTLESRANEGTIPESIRVIVSNPSDRPVRFALPRAMPWSNEPLRLGLELSLRNADGADGIAPFQWRSAPAPGAPLPPLERTTLAPGESWARDYPLSAFSIWGHGQALPLDRFLRPGDQRLQLLARLHLEDGAVMQSNAEAIDAFVDASFFGAAEPVVDPALAMGLDIARASPAGVVEALSSNDPLRARIARTRLLVGITQPPGGADLVRALNEAYASAGAELRAEIVALLEKHARTEELLRRPAAAPPGEARRRRSFPLSEATVATLLDALAAADPDGAASAARALGRPDMARAVPGLVAALGREPAALRAAAAAALGKIGDEVTRAAAGAPLTELLDAPEIEVRTAAGDALRELDLPAPGYTPFLERVEAHVEGLARAPAEATFEEAADAFPASAYASVVFLVDRSRSHSHFTGMKTFLARVIARLADGTRLGIVFFDRGQRTFPAQGAGAALTAETRAEALDFVRGTGIGGGSCLREGLAAALDIMASPGKKQALVYLGDGIETCPLRIVRRETVEAFALTREKTAQLLETWLCEPCQFHALGVDVATPERQASEHYLRYLAAKNRGAYTRIVP